MHWLLAKLLAEKFKNRNLAFLANTGVGDMLAYELAKISKGFIIDSMTFKYRRKITITEQSGNNLSDYQVRIDLDATNFDFSHFLNEGNDLRFTDANRNLLPYWVEKMDIAAEKATIWVKVPTIPANSSVSIYMYYGNSEVGSASKGGATFPFFDDFISPFIEIWNSGVIATGTSRDTARNVLVDGNYLYGVSSSAKKLVIYDISDINSPVQKSLTDTTYWNICVRKKGNYLLVSNEDGLDSWDVSDPTNPILVNHLSLGTYIHGTFLDGDYLYCCMHLADKFQIIDVSDPANPVLKGYLSGATYFNGCHDAHVEGNYAYVANYLSETGEYGFVVVDVSDKDNPAVVAYAGEAHKNSHIIKVGNYVYVGSHDPDSGITVYDVSDPLSPVYKGRFLTEYGVTTGYWFDQYDDTTLGLIKTTEAAKFILLDISTPDSPTVLDDLALGYPYCANVDIIGDYFFVSVADDAYNWYIYCYKIEPSGIGQGEEWNFGDTGSYSIENSELTLVNPKYAYSSASFGGGYALRVKAKVGADAADLWWCAFATTGDATADVDLTCALLRYTANSYYAFISGDGANSETGFYQVEIDNEYHIAEARRTETADRFQIDDFPELSGNYPTPIERVIQLYAYNADLVVDWVLVRKYAEPEPLVSIGAEETA